MKTLFLVILVVSLSGCSSFKMGGVAYCPFGQNCTFTMDTPQPAEKGKK